MVNSLTANKVNEYKKKAGITETGVKKYLNEENLRINPDNVKRLIFVIGNGLASKRNLNKENFIKEVFKFEKYLKELGLKTANAKNIDVFQMVRYL